MGRESRDSRGALAGLRETPVAHETSTGRERRDSRWCAGAVPESFGQLAALQWLYLHENQLTVLPESFGQLAVLQQLYLHENQMTVLPESFGQLTALQ